MKVLLVGSTGLLGPDICQRLAAAGHQVRALVRPTSDPGRQSALAALGVELTEGDLRDAASLSRACDGVEAAVSTASSVHSHAGGNSIDTVDRLGQLALVAAARQAGVERFVFVSFRENAHVQFPLTIAKREVERALIASRMTYTIIQASYFMEVWLSPALGFDVRNRKVRIYGDGTRPLSWVSYRDVARAAADAVSEPAARNAVIAFGGPDALSPREVVRMFEAAGIGGIALETVPETDLERQLQQATDPLQKSFAGLMLQYAAGDAIDPAASSRVFPFQRTSIRDFISAQTS